MVPSSTVVEGGFMPVGMGWWEGIGELLVWGVEGGGVAASWRDCET